MKNTLSRLLFSGLEEALVKQERQKEKKKTTIQIIFYSALLLVIALLVFLSNYDGDYGPVQIIAIVLGAAAVYVFLIFIIKTIMVASISKTKNKRPAKPALNFRKKGKKEKEKKEERNKRRVFSEYVLLAGYEIELKDLFNRVVKIAMVLCALATFALVFMTFRQGYEFFYAFRVTLFIWLLGLPMLMGLLFVAFFFTVDMRIYQRTKAIEEVLPDFLHLTSANISAGMPIDRALWFAVRPRFGVLAKEIEDVAKSTLVGEKLEDALKKFTSKYNSVILKRAINLLLEGVESGGEVGDLLNRIANNMEETRVIRKEMAANVTTYVIFITFATIVAAPFLFGLSTELIVIMQSILGSLDLGNAADAMASSSMAINVSGDAIAVSDYKTFVIMCLVVSAIFSAIIISVIKKGNAKEAIYQIPPFVAVSLIIYLVSTFFMHMMLGSMFA